MPDTQAPSQPKHAELLECFRREVEQLTNSDGWQRWLRSAGKFIQYSLQNQLLILSQRPDATRVAGYRTWQSLNRQVRRGEKGIAIIAPIRRRTEDDGGEPVLGVCGFTVVHVFDISQTEGEALPEIPIGSVQVPHESLLDELIRTARHDGITVVITTSAPADTRGWWSSSKRQITLVDGYDDAIKTRTMLHELAHAHDPVIDEPVATDRAVREIVAESAAYIVGTSLLGMQMDEYSLTYVASWSGWGTDTTLLEAAAERTLATARALEAFIAAPPLPLDL